jgi:ABC-type sugar transport system substrate-binding protein
MKRSFLIVIYLAVVLTVIFVIAAYGINSTPPEPPTPTQEESVKAKKSYEDLVVGYAQIGAESDWRTGNTVSIKEEAERLGVELRFADAQQKQENQIKAIRSFIAQQVDVIGVSPVVETGWEDVFQEAKDAGIPVILVDRRADVPKDLYVTHVGSDFVKEGRNAARVMVELLDRHGKIVELVGTIDSAPANDRYKGFREILKDYPEMEIIASESGDFTRARGKEVMEDFLNRYGDEIDALYAHNDDMAIGAIKAMEEVGLKPGKDIVIVSVDAIGDAFKAMVAGKLNCSVECTPLLGPLLMKAVKDYFAGKTLPVRIVTSEEVFPAEVARRARSGRKY